MYLVGFRFLKSVKYLIKNKTIQVGYYYYYLHNKIYTKHVGSRIIDISHRYQGQHKINNYDNIMLLNLIIASYYLY